MLIFWKNRNPDMLVLKAFECPTNNVNRYISADVISFL